MQDIQVLLKTFSLFCFNLLSDMGIARFLDKKY
jgi:hypothetical protein